MSPNGAASLDDTIRLWRQGDCVPGPNEFVFRLDPKLPSTPASQEAVREDPDATYAAQPVEGFMVITQTCDLVKPIAGAPFVEVSPLVTLTPAVFEEVRLGARPRFVTVPPLHSTLQAADLDRILTIEKACLALWPRQSGCRTDTERRKLGLQLGRKLQRAALPDFFAPWFNPLRKRFNRLKHANSPEAVAFQDLDDIRVQPHPFWDAPEVTLFFWFILKDEAPEADRSKALEEWLGRLVPAPPVTQVEGRVVHYVDMLASEYLDSDPLDLDHFSPEEPEES